MHRKITVNSKARLNLARKIAGSLYQQSITQSENRML